MLDNGVALEIFQDIGAEAGFLTRFLETRAERNPVSMKTASRMEDLGRLVPRVLLNIVSIVLFVFSGLLVVQYDVAVSGRCSCTEPF